MATKDTGGGQAQSQKSHQQDETDQAVTETNTEAVERREKLGEDVDAMLDEIDDVLEENAEDFVRGYVQKGGQ